MPFGFSIGDGIAVAGLIERIATEIKDYHQAPEHFQQLAIELDFLRQVLVQLQQINTISSRQDEIAHFDRIKAIATHCGGPLSAFLDKMVTFEPYLGKHKVTGGFKGVGKRLHWSMSISKKEVGELRAVVLSQILAISTLLNAQQWECLQALETRQGANARALEDLIKKITGFEQRMELCFKDRDDLKNKIQQVLDLVTSDRQSSAQERLLLSTNVTANNSLKNTSKGFKRISNLAAKLEQGLKMLSSLTADILAAIQSNKQLLLELFAMIKWLQRQLPKHIDLPIIRLDDALGNSFALPFQMCSEWKTFRKLLKNLHQLGDARFRVEQGLFEIANAKGGRVLTEHEWKNSVVSGDHLSMSIVVTTSVGPKPVCPFSQCSGVLVEETSSTGHYTCSQCGRWSSRKPSIFRSECERCSYRNSRTVIITEAERGIPEVAPSLTSSEEGLANSFDITTPTIDFEFGKLKDDPNLNLYRRISISWRCRVCAGTKVNPRTNCPFTHHLDTSICSACDLRIARAGLVNQRLKDFEEDGEEEVGEEEDGEEEDEELQPFMSLKAFISNKGICRLCGGTEFYRVAEDLEVIHHLDQFMCRACAVLRRQCCQWTTSRFQSLRPDPTRPLKVQLVDTCYSKCQDCQDSDALKLIPVRELNSLMPLIAETPTENPERKFIASKTSF